MINATDHFLTEKKVLYKAPSSKKTKEIARSNKAETTTLSNAKTTLQASNKTNPPSN
jgi:hypothetical protein